MFPKELENILLNLPELVAGKGIWQNNHHEFDVFMHSVECARYMMEFTDDIDLIAAAFLHDIGKPSIRILKYVDGVLMEKRPGEPYHKFTGHAAEGEKIVRAMTYDFFGKFNLNKEKIARLVGAHYFPTSYIKKMRKVHGRDAFIELYRQLESELDASGVERGDLMLLFHADQKAHGKGDSASDELSILRFALLGKPGMKDRLFELQNKRYTHK